ncbi:phosphatidate cytidylyltransferase [Moraxella osloensis]|nr:phosphatidate cytidylyltransferase [Moraxella osloensis]MBW4017878.1 phosphatidate cytidylyltransferase [Moraxella osloensis]
MWERIRTAIILLVIVGVAMFATREPILMLPLLLVGAGFGAFEWSKLMPSLEQNSGSYVPPTTQIPTKPAKPIDYMYTLVMLGIVSVLLVMAKLTGSIASWVFFWLVAALIWLVAIGWIRRYPNNTQAWYGKQLYVIGMIVLSSAITAMYYLWLLSAWWLLYVFVLVWCADSGAYFVGRKLGRRKMSPHVSPNKSVEGLLGGLATGTLVVIGVSFGLLNDWSMTVIGVFLLLSLLTIIMSVFGDLFESMLKRHAGVKDAGALLPGHGGILDRIDSQLSAVPIFALGFWAMKFYGLI